MTATDAGPDTPPLPPHPGFDEFFGHLYGYEPFPWQQRMAEAASVGTPGWYDEIGVPTGTGKTACLDAAVWALASQADRPPAQRTAATRTWYVVNRRLLVDAAHDRAVTIAEALRDAAHEGSTTTPVGAVAHRLLSLCANQAGDVGPLHVVRLRGGTPLGRRAHDLTQPTIVLATVPHFTSRLLFRGYGTSMGMRPVDAAHAGLDSLVLLDEAHLTPHLRRVIDHSAECDPGDPTSVLPLPRTRPHLVGLTATGRPDAGRLDLDEKDLAHPKIQERIHACKRAHLHWVDEAKSTADILAELAIEALDQAHVHRVLVFANTVATARVAVAKAEARAKKRSREGPGVDVLLLTGQVRSYEAASTVARLLNRTTGMPAHTERDRSSAPDRDLVVVATQTLEVGADLDADHLVTEATGARALVQRLGRLNRLGQLAESNADIVVARDTYQAARVQDEGKRKGWPVYGLEPADVIDRIEAAPDDTTGTWDLSPAVAAKVVGAPQDTPRRPAELLPAHLWEWVKTSCPPPGEATLEPFYEGLTDPDWRISICWRSYLPPDGAKIVPRIHADETVDISPADLEELLKQYTRRHRPPSDSDTTIKVRRLSSTRSSLETLEGDAGEIASSLRPGDTVVLDVGIGGHAQRGFDPKSKRTVPDRTFLDTGILVLAPDSVGHIAPGIDHDDLRDLLDPFADPEMHDQRELQAAALALIDVMAGLPPADDPDRERWSLVLDELRDAKRRGVPRLVVPDDGGEPRLLPSRGGPTDDVQVDDLDELSFDLDQDLPHTLDGHQALVANLAERTAAGLGLREPLVEACALAARLHDAGKSDPRFQGWLNPDHDRDAGDLLAKSERSSAQMHKGRAAAGWPLGGRHETLSMRLAGAYVAASPARSWAAAYEDLVMHLIAAHHGHARPSLPTAHDATTIGRLTTAIDGTLVTVDDDLSHPDWDQPTRFRRLCETYGYWGLALLETLVRQADHTASGYTRVV